MYSERRDVDAALGTLAGIATALRDPATAAEADAVRRRVEHERFVVACVGQFKRGKSTLINALIGDPVLPAGIVPVTAITTVVRFGQRRLAHVLASDGLTSSIDVDALAEYVSEARNPANAKRITAVEVNDPSPLLSSGLCLVDTPGLGSVVDANTQT